MILGRFAVGILLFVLTFAMHLGIVKIFTDDTNADLVGWGCFLIIILTTYCTTSGLWLLIHFGYI